MKKFNFAITDNTSYTGKDAYDFYSKALLEGGSKSLFRLIPGVKSIIKLPRYDAGNIIQAEGCSWSATGEGTLSQKSLAVCAKSIQLEFCTTTFETNFLSEIMRQGSNTGEVSPAAFTDYMVSEVGKKVQNDLEVAVWQGNAGGTAYPYTICDGLQLLMGSTAYGTVVTVAGASGGLTAGNIIAEMAKAYAAIPNTVVNSPDLRFFMPTSAVKLYFQALASASAESYYAGAKDANFLGIPIVTASGMGNNKMVVAETTNLVLLTDLLSDEETLNILPQFNVTGVNSLRIAGNFKFGVNFLVAEDIVFYS